MQFGRYQVVRMVGQGGMATVYEACDPRLNQRVAIKVLHPALAGSAELVARFEAEARIVNGIRHPGIVAIYDQGRLRDGAIYHVMEFLEGETLTQRIKRSGLVPLCPEETYRILRQLADTLCAVHLHGIVHRDLKPDNLMLVPDAFVAGGVRVKILDFGLAKVLSDNAKPHGIDTQAGIGMGTVDYMPPEQILDARNSNDRADVYSLGCILFEMAAGRKPFCGDNNIQILGAHLTRPPPLLSEYTLEHPRALSTLLSAMLSKEVDQRPSMRYVLQQLDAVWGAYLRQSSNTVVMQPGAVLPMPRRHPLTASVAASPQKTTASRLPMLVTLGTATLFCPLLLFLHGQLASRGTAAGPARSVDSEVVQDAGPRDGNRPAGERAVPRRQGGAAADPAVVPAKPRTQPRGQTLALLTALFSR